MRAITVVIGTFALTAAAVAQCVPEWDTALGNPGITSGYVEPIFSWDDGTGPALYVGGSFDNIGGIGSKLLAKFDPDTGDFSRLASGLSTGSTNGFLTSLAAYNTDAGQVLVAGGFFHGAVGVADTQSIAYWDGSAWHSLGAGFVPPDAVWSLDTANLGDGPLLYLAGGFTTIAGLPASGVATWDGENLAVVGDGLGMTGFSPFVNETLVWDDGSGPALYAVGRFDSIDGVSTKLAARYRPGSGWEKIGAGVLSQSSTTTLDAAVIFDDGTGEALYIAGSPFRPAGVSGYVTCCKWDGSTWTKVGQSLGGRTTDLVVWDDGTGPALYQSGTAQPDIHYLARLEGNQWVTVAGGVGGDAIPPSTWPSVFGLGLWMGDLVVGGNYTLTGDAQPANGLAVYTSCACPADFNHDGVVDSKDFIAFLNAFVAGDPSADFNNDGEIDSKDFIAFLNAFVAGC